MCIGFVAVIASLMPKFRTYDVRTNEFAVKEAEIRKKRKIFKIFFLATENYQSVT